MLCDLQIFSGTVHHLKQPDATSLLFPKVFGNILIPFFDGKKSHGVHSIIKNCLRFFDHSSHHLRARGGTKSFNENILETECVTMGRQ